MLLAIIVVVLATFIELWQFWGRSKRKKDESRKIIDESGIVQSNRTASYYKGRKTPFIDKSELKSLKSLDNENIKKINKKYKEMRTESGKKKSKLTYLALMPWKRFYGKEIRENDKITKFQSKSSDYDRIYTRKKPLGYEKHSLSIEMTPEEILGELKDHQNELLSTEDKALNPLKIVNCPDCGTQMDINNIDSSYLVCSCGNRIFTDDYENNGI